MRDLAADDRFSPLPIHDADVWYLAHLPMPEPDQTIFERLRRETEWRHEEVRVWGKTHLQPRLTAWYGDAGADYKYSGTVMRPLPWTELLSGLRHELEALTGARFNSVLLNLYRDQNDRMGFHSDDEPSLGTEPTIASLSYGATRTLIFRHRRLKNVGRQRVCLPSGSLLLMRGPTQSNWAHGVERESRPCGPRINLTFRRIVHRGDTPQPRKGNLGPSASLRGQVDGRAPRARRDEGGSAMPVSEMSAVERIARVLAGQRLSANAGGVDPSAGDAVDMEWQDHVADAVAVLKTLREPDPAMARAGDPATWERMVEAALSSHGAGSR